jgi:predicted porin
MKLKQTLVVTTLAAAPVAVFAQSSVTVYGRLDVSVDRTKTGSSSLWEVNDNASRLGFRGVEDLGGGMKAHFGIESGFNADNGVSPTTSTQPFYRNSYVGLQSSSFGFLSVGRTDSANPAGSPIYSIVTANIVPAVHDSGAPAFGTRILNARNRFNNAINYRAPTFAGLSFRARFALNGENATAATNENQIKNFDASLNYALGGLGLAAGYSKNKYDGIATPSNSFDNKWMLIAAYKFEPVKVYATYGKDRYINLSAASRRTDVPYWLIGSSAEFGSHEVTANIMERAVQSDRNGKMKKWHAAYAYNFTKRTQVYALYDNDDPNSNLANNTIKSFSVGIQHNF